MLSKIDDKKHALKICFVGWGDSIHTQRWMKWFVDNGHQVYLITDQPSGSIGVTEYDISIKKKYAGNRLSRYLRLEFNVYYVRKLLNIFRIHKLKQVIATIRAIWKIRPDILHLHTLFYPINIAVYSGFHPMVVTIWNGDIVWKMSWSLLRKCAVKKGLRTADIITVDSEELRHKVMAYGNYQNKIEYISFSVDTTIFNPENKARNVRKRLDIKEGAPIILSTRSFQDIYNIDVVVSAIPSVLKIFPEAIFIFCWHSETRKKEILELVSRLGVEKNTRIVGKVEDRVELANYYAEASVYVNIPSYDTIAISLLEAMACGVAPVVTNLVSIKECIKDGLNGCRVSVRDIDATARAIILLLRDEGLRKRFVAYNLELVKERFDWDKNMRMVEVMYYNLRQKSFLYKHKENVPIENKR